MWRDCIRMTLSILIYYARYQSYFPAIMQNYFAKVYFLPHLNILVRPLKDIYSKIKDESSESIDWLWMHLQYAKMQVKSEREPL